MIGTGTNVAGVQQGISNAQAASQIAQANAYGGALSNAGNLYALSSLIGKGNQTGIVNTPYSGYLAGPDYSQPIGNLISTAD